MGKHRTLNGPKPHLCLQVKSDVVSECYLCPSSLWLFLTGTSFCLASSCKKDGGKELRDNVHFDCLISCDQKVVENVIFWTRNKQELLITCENSHL